MFRNNQIEIFKINQTNIKRNIQSKNPLTPIISYGKILLLCLKVGVVRPFGKCKSAKIVLKLNFIKQKQLKK